MTITPTGTRIYLGLKPIQKVGDLDVSSKKTVQEWGTVESVGEKVTTVKVGDTIMFKAWGLDSLTHQKQEYFFIDEQSGAICAIIKDEIPTKG